MNCPQCHNINQFKVSKNVIYCIAEIDGYKCMYHLNKSERDQFRSEQKLNKKKQNKSRNGITLNQIADLNDVHRNTARKHVDEFDVIPNSKPIRYKYNSKIFKENWQGLREKELKNYVEYKPTHYHGIEIIYSGKFKK